MDIVVAASLLRLVVLVHGALSTILMDDGLLGLRSRVIF